MFCLLFDLQHAYIFCFSVAVKWPHITHIQMEIHISMLPVSPTSLTALIGMTIEATIRSATARDKIRRFETLWRFVSSTMAAITKALPIIVNNIINPRTTDTTTVNSTDVITGPSNADGDVLVVRLCVTLETFQLLLPMLIAVELNS